MATRQIDFTLVWQILQVCLQALTGISPDGLNNILLSQGYVLGTTPTVGTVGKAHIPGTGEEIRRLQLPGSKLKVSW